MAWVGPAIPAPGGGRTRSLGGRLTYYGAVELCGGREIAGVQTEDQVVRVNDIVEVEVAVRVSGHHHQGKKSESTAADQQPYLAQVESFWEDGFTGIKTARARWLLRASEASRIILHRQPSQDAPATTEVATTATPTPSYTAEGTISGADPAEASSAATPATNSTDLAASAKGGGGGGGGGDFFGKSSATNESSPKNGSRGGGLAVATTRSSVTIENDGNGCGNGGDIINTGRASAFGENEVLLTPLADEIDVRSIVGLAPVSLTAPTFLSTRSSSLLITPSNRNSPRRQLHAPVGATAGNGRQHRGKSNMTLTLARVFDPFSGECTKLETDHVVVQQLRSRMGGSPSECASATTMAGSDGGGGVVKKEGSRLSQATEIDDNSNNSTNVTHNGRRHKVYEKGSCARATREQSRRGRVELKEEHIEPPSRRDKSPAPVALGTIGAERKALAGLLLSISPPRPPPPPPPPPLLENREDACGGTTDQTADNMTSAPESMEIEGDDDEGEEKEEQQQQQQQQQQQEGPQQKKHQGDGDDRGSAEHGHNNFSRKRRAESCSPRCGSPSASTNPAESGSPSRLIAEKTHESSSVASASSSLSTNPFETGRYTRRKTGNPYAYHPSSSRSLPPPSTRSSGRLLSTTSPPPQEQQPLLPSGQKRPRRLEMPPHNVLNFFGTISGSNVHNTRGIADGGAGGDDIDARTRSGSGVAPRRGRPRGGVRRPSMTKEILPSTTPVGPEHQVDIPDLLPREEIDAARAAQNDGSVGCELVWRSTADWVTEDKCRLDDYLNAAKAAAAAQRAVIHQVRGSPVLLSLGGDNSGQSDKNLGVEGQGGERNMAWGLTCSGDSNGDDGQIWAGRSEKELLKVPRSTLQSAQTDEAAMHALFHGNTCILDDNRPALQRLVNNISERNETEKWTFAQIQALEEAMEKDFEGDKPKDPDEADPDDYIDLCDVSISVPGKSPQQVLAFYARYMAFAKPLTDVHNSPEAAVMRAKREATKPQVAPPPEKAPVSQTPPPTLRHRPSLRQPPRLSYEHQMSRAAKARKERERLNLPLALRKTRREAAVKGCRKVTSLVVGDSSGGDGSSSGELSSSGDGDSDASCSDQAIDNEEEISLPRKRSRHHGGGGGNSSSNSNGREGRGGGRSSSKHKGAKGSSSRSSRSRVSSCGGGGGNTSRGKGVSRLLPKNKQERRLYQKYARTTAKISRLRACSSPSDASSAADGDSNSTRGGVAGGAGGRWSCSARRRSSLSSLTLGGSNASDKMRPKHLSGLSVDGYPPIRRYSESNGEFDPFRLIRSEAAAADRIEYSGRSGLYGGSGSSMENPAHSRRREVGWNRDYGPGAFSGEMRGYKRSFHEHGRGSGDHRDWRNSDVTKFSSGDCGRRGEGERRQSLHSMFPGAVLQVSDDDVDNGSGYGREGSLRSAASLPQISNISNSSSSNNGSGSGSGNGNDNDNSSSNNTNTTTTTTTTTITTIINNNIESNSNSNSNSDFRRPYASYFEPSERELEQFFSHGYDPGFPDSYNNRAQHHRYRSTGSQCHPPSSQRYPQHQGHQEQQQHSVSPGSAQARSQVQHHQTHQQTYQQPHQSAPHDNVGHSGGHMMPARWERGPDRSEFSGRGSGTGPTFVGAGPCDANDPYGTSGPYVGSETYGAAGPYDRTGSYCGATSGGCSTGGGGGGGRARGVGTGGGERVGGCAGSSRSRRRDDGAAGNPGEESARSHSPMTSCWFLLDEAQRFLDTERVRYLEGLLATHSRRNMSYAQLEARAASCLYDKPDVLTSFKRIFKLMDVAPQVNTARQHHQHHQHHHNPRPHPHAPATSAHASHPGMPANHQHQIFGDCSAAPPSISDNPAHAPPSADGTDSRRSSVFAPAALAPPCAMSAADAAAAAAAFWHIGNSTSRSVAPASTAKLGAMAESRQAEYTREPESQYAVGGQSSGANLGISSSASLGLIEFACDRSSAFSAAGTPAGAPQGVAAPANTPVVRASSELSMGDGRGAVTAAGASGVVGPVSAERAPLKVDALSRTRASDKSDIAAPFATAPQEGVLTAAGERKITVAGGMGGSSSGVDVVAPTALTVVSAGSEAAGHSPDAVDPTSSTPKAPRTPPPTTQKSLSVRASNGMYMEKVTTTATDGHASTTMRASAPAASATGGTTEVPQNQLRDVVAPRSCRAPDGDSRARMRPMSSNGGGTVAAAATATRMVVKAPSLSSDGGTEVTRSEESLQRSPIATNAAASAPASTSAADPACVTINVAPTMRSSIAESTAVKALPGMLRENFPPATASKTMFASPAAATIAVPTFVAPSPAPTSGVADRVTRARSTSQSTGAGAPSGMLANFFAPIKPSTAASAFTSTITVAAVASRPATASSAVTPTTAPPASASSGASSGVSVGLSRARATESSGSSPVLADGGHASMLAKAKALARAAFADGKFARAVENGESAARASMESVERFVKAAAEAEAAADAAAAQPTATEGAPMNEPKELRGDPVDIETLTEIPVATSALAREGNGVDQASRNGSRVSPAQRRSRTSPAQRRSAGQSSRARSATAGPIPTSAAVVVEEATTPTTLATSAIAMDRASALTNPAAAMPGGEGGARVFDPAVVNNPVGHGPTLAGGVLSWFGYGKGASSDRS